MNGGNAVDAASASVAAQGVVAPETSGIGGDLFALIHRPGWEKPVALNASGRSGSKVSVAILPDSDETVVPRDHPSAVTIPGCVDGFVALSDEFSALDLGDALAPAIELARSGFEVSTEQAAAFSKMAAVYQDNPAVADFYPNGQPVARVAVITRLDLSATFEPFVNSRRAPSLLYPRPGRAQIAGITGGSGTGKSTLTGQLAKEYRRRGRSVGVVAVDPSSPFSHGALLGDRIRMQDVTPGGDVCAGSMRPGGGGDGRAGGSGDVHAVVEAAGEQVVVRATVGAGQDEVAVASAADTSVVVLTPGGGDGVQAMKAGIMEIADVLVINKADLAGVDALAAQLTAITPRDTHVPVIRTVATRNEGTAELADAIDAHRQRLESSGERERVALDRARRHVLAQARQQLLAGLLDSESGRARLDQLVKAVAARELDPYTAAQRLLDSAGGEPASTT